MGGWGSGRRWGSKSTTSGFCKLDVRQLQRDGILEQRFSSNWVWSRDGERVSDIDMRPESDRLNLIYRVRSAADEWELLNYPVFLERTSCNYGATGFGLDVQQEGADVESQFYTEDTS